MGGQKCDLVAEFEDLAVRFIVWGSDRNIGTSPPRKTKKKSSNSNFKILLFINIYVKYIIIHFTTPFVLHFWVIFNGVWGLILAKQSYKFYSWVEKIAQGAKALAWVQCSKSPLSTTEQCLSTSEGSPNTQHWFWFLYSLTISISDIGSMSILALWWWWCSNLYSKSLNH